MNVKKHLQHYQYFYGYLGVKMWLALLGALLVALIDGIGLTMFIPLLQAIDGGSPTGAGENLGNLQFITEAISAVSIPLTVTYVLLLILAFFIVKAALKYATRFYRVTLQQRFSNSVRLESLRLLAGYEYRAFARADSGRIQNSLSGEANQVASSFRFYLTMLQQVAMVAVYVAMAFLANPQFAVLIAVGGLLTNAVFRGVYRRTKEASRRMVREMHRFQGYLIQSVGNFKYLKATGLMQRYEGRIAASINDIEIHQRRVGQMNALSGALQEPLIIGLAVLAVLVQTTVFSQPLGPMLLSLLLLYRGLASVGQLQNSYTQFLGVSGSLENLRSFKEELRGDQEPDRGLILPTIGSGIEVRSLDYAYDGTPVLNGVSLTIPANETVGVVGESGTGKTTLVNIICGLLRAEPGQLLIGGVDSAEINLAGYRTKIGYVTQEAPIFSDTIRNNVTFWALGAADDDKVWSALKNAHADGFVRELPHGLDTRIGINGVNLSGGQRQRISIARELYRDVELLILDEATSALDSQSEQLIQQNIEELKGSYTMIVIAHRLSTVRNADKILFLQKGGLYQTGTFEGLRARSASFRNLVQLQSVA